MKKRLLSGIIALLLVVTSQSAVFASTNRQDTVKATNPVYKNQVSSPVQQANMYKEINEELSKLEFDLNSSEVQEKQITLSNGEKVTVGVAPEHSSDKGNSNKLQVSNGTHKIYFYGIIANVTFNVNVSNNRITRAFDPWYLIIGASVKSSNLKVDNSKQATYFFEFTTPIWELGGWTGWVRANINSSNKLVVSIK